MASHFLTRVALATAVALSLPFAAIADDSNPYNLLTPGTISVGTMADSKPNTFVEADGTYTGFDIELFRNIAERMGYTDDKVAIVAQDFSALMPSVTNQRFDVAIAAIGTTEERKKNVDFSDGYLLFYLSVLSADASIKEVADLKGKRVGAVQGALSDIYSTKNFTDALIVRFPDNNTAIAALNNGTIDAHFQDHDPAVEYSKRYPNLQIRIDVPMLDTPAGFVVRKGNAPLREGINKGLQAAIDDGTYAKIFAKWFPDAPLPERFESKN
ncbi:amino acid ABC transporter substrate-binding protein [Ensifer sp. ENS06]|uniref:ABC transporter substrate-binding protein n=1 Tax=Ensifer sp. ENS06 TaxID=2769276 RepID=UPI0017821B97|nr:ABC transporter substrate-binding protein [Ensifer sp. ENS06]MBD9626959.1 amino acid ABC transporter substrate-binding protein [Ensifer sp. ENS06]